MKTGDFLGGSFRAGALLFVSIFVSGFFLSACSKAAPKCDSGKTIDAVIHEVSQDMKKDYNFVAGMGSGELSDDEWRTIRSGIIITVDNISEQNDNKDTDKRTCAGNLMIQESSGKESIPVIYIPEIDKASGEVRVALSGYQEYKNKKKDPLISKDQ